MCKLTKYVALGIAVLFFIGLNSCTKSEAPTLQKTLTVGIAVPLTGDSASWGEKGKDAVNLAFDQKNAYLKNKGINIKFVFEDSQGNANGGTAAIRALLDRSNPIAVIGGITSGETAAMVPLTKERSVLLISPSASAESLSQAGPFFFRLWPPDSFETKLFVRYLVDRGVKDLAILTIQNEYGVGVRTIFEETFKQLGGKIVSSDGYSPTETNFRPVLLKLKKRGVKSIYIAGYYKDASQIVLQDEGHRWTV